MATNSGWPEAFGFSMSYGRPCIVDWVEEGGSAEQSGLQVIYINILYIYTACTIDRRCTSGS